MYEFDEARLSFEKETRTFEDFQRFLYNLLCNGFIQQDIYIRWSDDI